MVPHHHSDSGLADYRYSEFGRDFDGETSVLRKIRVSLRDTEGDGPLLHSMGFPQAQL